MAITTSLISASAISADAATAVTIHKIKGKTIKKSAKTTIKPRVTSSSRTKITAKTITVKKGGRTLVSNKTSARIKPGNYRVTTKVTFKTWKTVSKTRQVKSLWYDRGSMVSSSCTISATSGDSLTPRVHVGCRATDFTSTAYSSDLPVQDNGDGTWTVMFADWSTQVLAAAGLEGLRNQTVRGQVIVGSDVYQLSTERYQQRQYSKTQHTSKSQSLKIKAKKVKKAKKPNPDHACTLTASGTCIQGGQFCPKAKYGESGWDANGRRYVCTGDSSHPHWMKP